MLRDSDQRSHSRPAHSSFFANRKPPLLIPSLVVGAVFLLALLFLTVPNWGEFSRNVSQFPALWQVSSNRREIIFLVIRVCSPLAARRHRWGVLLVMVHDQGVSQAGDTTCTCSATRVYAAFITCGTEVINHFIHAGDGAESRAITSSHPHSTRSLRRPC